MILSGKTAAVRRSLPWLGSMATKQDPTVNLKPAKEIEAPMAEVVACVAQLGGIAEVQATLRRHLPMQVITLSMGLTLA